MARTVEWERLVVAVQANQEDLPHLAEGCAELAAAVSALRSLQVRRRQLEAESLRRTQELQALAERSRGLVSRLRHGVRAVYGNRSEKLAAFGVKGFAGRPRKKVRLAEREGSPKPAHEG